MKKILFIILISVLFGFQAKADTLTVYPDPDPENTSVDGDASIVSSGLSWSSLVTGNGTNSTDANTLLSGYDIQASSINNQWDVLGRGIILFDTSTLTSSVNISSAVISFVGYDKDDGLSILPDINIYSSNPSSNTSVQISDYQSIGSTAYSTAKSYDSFSTSGAYNNFTLNSNGLSAISKTGISKFAARNANYDTANNPPTWSNSLESYIFIRSAETAGTSQDPKLVITYTSSSVANENPDDDYHTYSDN